MLTGVGSAGGATGGVVDAVLLLGGLGVEVALSLLGDVVKVLTLVCGRHCDRCVLVFGKEKCVVGVRVVRFVER